MNSDELTRHWSLVSLVVFDSDDGILSHICAQVGGTRSERVRVLQQAANRDYLYYRLHVFSVQSDIK